MDQTTQALVLAPVAVTLLATVAIVELPTTLQLVTVLVIATNKKMSSLFVKVRTFFIFLPEVPQFPHGESVEINPPIAPFPQHN